MSLEKFNMNTIELTCEYCGNKYIKAMKEYKRTTKHGYRSFCCRTCGDNYKKKNGQIFATHLYDWINSDANKKHISSFVHEKRMADPFNIFIRRISNKGKQKKITVDDLKNVWCKQGGKCAYTGIELTFPKSGSHKTISTASVDRIDSNKGYILDNIQFVCVMANYAKNDFSHEIMVKFCQAIKSNI